jgi:hypothetical protein
MKKMLLTMALLLLGSQRLSAQTLPFYGYADSPDCVKNAMEKTEYKTEEGAKTFCDLERASREGLLKKWNAIPSSVKWKCITDSNSQSYVMLSLCIDQQFKNNSQDGDDQQNSDN